MRSVRAFVASVALAILVAAFPFGGSAPGPTVSIHQSFAAGEWIVIYVYVPDGTTTVSVSGTLNAYTQAPLTQEVGLFTAPPALLVDRSGTTALVAGPHTPRVVVQPHGGGIVRTEKLDGTLAASGLEGTGSIVAVQMAFAASRAWTLDLDVTIPQATFAVVYRYGGALFARADAPPSPIADIQELTFHVPSRGWTHVSMESMHLQPIGIRHYDVRFPNGFASTGTAQMLGSPSSMYWGGFGATNDAAGPLHARVSYYEMSLGVPLALVHLPWPPNHGIYDANYRTVDGTKDVALPSL